MEYNRSEADGSAKPSPAPVLFLVLGSSISSRPSSISLPQVPTGTYLDMTAKLPVVDPAKVLSPVLLVRGEYDGIATVDHLSDFFKRLPSGDRHFVILPGMAHSVLLGVNRQRFWHVMHSFLS